MEALFNQVLQASLQGGILIGVVIALRLILRGAPKKYVCLLWLMAVVRLLVPLDISSTLSLQPTVPSPARLIQACRTIPVKDSSAPPQTRIPAPVGSGMFGLRSSLPSPFRRKPPPKRGRSPLSRWSLPLSPRCSALP